MIPIVIQDYINAVLDKKTHHEKRQFYYATLLTIQSAITRAINDYEEEKKKIGRQ